METRICKQCSKGLTGRAHKMFCNDRCRANYNNKRVTAGSKLVRQINLRLIKNRVTLKRLLNDIPKGSCVIPGITLRDYGFYFQYFTNINKKPGGKTYYYCYEYGYAALENDSYLVVKSTCVNDL